MAGGSLGKLFVELGIDTAALEKGIGKAKSAIGGLGVAFQKHGKAIGAAMAGVGVGLMTLTDSSMKTNAALGTTALQLGISTKEMRELAIETANVTFPLSEVQASFDLLTRAGMTNADQISVSATAFDTLGDAIGLPASEVTRSLIPAFNAFGIPLEDAAANTDMLTHLMRNSTVELSAFANMVNRLSPDLATMDMSMQEVVAVMEALADKGIQGTAATLEFRTAVSSADGDVNAFYEALGLTAGEVATYTEEIDGATGMTDEFAAAQNKQFSTMDKIKHSVSEMTLKYGSLLQPLEALGPIMMGLGPAMMLMATIQWGTLIPALTAHAVAAWAAITPYLIIIAPLLAVIAILAILEHEFGFVTKTIQFLTGIFSPLIVALKNAAGYTSDNAGEAKKLTSAYEELQGVISETTDLTEDAADQIRNIERATFGVEDAQKKYNKTVADYGVESGEAKRAALDLLDAEDRLDDARQAHTETIRAIADSDTRKTAILKDNNVGSVGELEKLMQATDGVVWGIEEEARMMGLAKVAADALADAQKNVSDSAIEVDKLTSAYEDLQGAIADALGLTEDVDDQARSVEHAVFGMEDAQKKYNEAVKEHGPYSDEAARADLRLRDAVDRLDDAEKKLVKTKGELTEADTKQTEILKENGVTSVGDLKTKLDKKEKLLKEAQAKELVMQSAQNEATTALQDHQNEMDIKAQEKAATESERQAAKQSKRKAAMIASAFLGPLGTLLPAIMTLNEQFNNAGTGLMIAFADGITSGIDAACEAAETAAGRVREFFTGSDAKRGPLSNITASGAALMTTFEKGIASANIDLSHSVDPILPQTIMAAPVAAPAAASTSTTSSSSVSMGDVHLSHDFDFMALMAQIDAYQATKRTQRGVI